jgi:cytochrome c-type biogenesis protein CcmH
MKALLLCLTLLSASAVAQPESSAARYADTQLADPRQERAAQALMVSIRCLVCQGQSIADSDAAMAGDMRALIRGRVAAGEAPPAIRAWLIERYGRWISYDPPLDAVTWPLWLAPLALVAIGGLVAARTIRRRRR